MLIIKCMQTDVILVVIHDITSGVQVITYFSQEVRITIFYHHFFKLMHMIIFFFGYNEPLSWFMIKITYRSLQIYYNLKSWVANNIGL